MARKKVLYFFAFQSPYAALADFRADYMVESAGGELEPVPVVPPPSDPPTGVAALVHQSRREYMLEDSARWARHLAIPWKPPAPGPVSSRDAVAGYYYARERGQERNYRNAVFRSRWCEGRDIDDLTVLAECAEDCRLSPNDFLQALRSRLYHQTIDAAIDLCLQHGVFGVPTFVYAGQRFWGNDRLDFLVASLRGESGNSGRG